MKNNGQKNTPRLEHPFGLLYSEHSRILILGSFPSVRSREEGFYYGHPQNRFWKVIAGLYGCPEPAGTEEKKALILDHGLALWDCIAECAITGSSDASIREAKVNDLSMILKESPVRVIACNGKTAYRLYSRYLQPGTGIEALCLPSTSPANARWTLDMLLKSWAVLTQ